MSNQKTVAGKFQSAISRARDLEEKMNFKRNILGGVGSIVLALLFVSTSLSMDVDFEKDIKPIFERHCVSCHGPEKDESFRIDDRDDALAYVEAGSSEDSDMYLLLVTDDEEELMPPPEDGIPLTKEQIELVKNWIDEGADWPEGIELVDTSKQERPPSDTNANDETDKTEEPVVEQKDPDGEDSENKPVKKKPAAYDVTRRIYAIFVHTLTNLDAIKRPVGACAQPERSAYSFLPGRD